MQIQHPQRDLTEIFTCSTLMTVAGLTADWPKKSLFILNLIHSSRASFWLQHLLSFQDRFRRRISLIPSEIENWIRILTSHLGKTNKEVITQPYKDWLIFSLAALFLFKQYFCNCQRGTATQCPCCLLISRDVFVFWGFLPSFKNKQ